MEDLTPDQIVQVYDAMWEARKWFSNPVPDDHIHAHVWGQEKYDAMRADFYEAMAVLQPVVLSHRHPKASTPAVPPS